ncbi:GAF domain-containing protein [Nannocystis pusilla]|uniref:GAF domain-containing protein n=1 Tax=Nannocystis pusilla TaxID=889268 RepID=UPI003B7CDC54
MLERLLDRLMRIVMLRAGAQRGFLLVPQDESWAIAAEMRTSPDEVVVGRERPMTEDAPLATSVVRFVGRSREGLVLADAGAEPRFARDSYVAGHQPKSVLCLPLLHQGRLSGVLYVENNAARDAFVAERVELLQLLSAQAAAAIENARLYASVQQAHEQLRRANEGLEQQVAGRTRDLQAAIDQLQAVNADLARQSAALQEAHAQTQREVGERERAERERAAAQAEIVRVQEERLADMAAPLLPITETIVVMPLIGLVDEARASQVLAAALEGSVRTRAQVVILDITGVRQLDATAAAILVRAAGALRLVGAQAILTGCGPRLRSCWSARRRRWRGLSRSGRCRAGWPTRWHRLAAGPDPAGRRAEPVRGGPGRANSDGARSLARLKYRNGDLRGHGTSPREVPVRPLRCERAASPGAGDPGRGLEADPQAAAGDQSPRDHRGGVHRPGQATRIHRRRILSGALRGRISPARGDPTDRGGRVGRRS